MIHSRGYGGFIGFFGVCVWGFLVFGFFLVVGFAVCLGLFLLLFFFFFFFFLLFFLGGRGG